MSFYDMITDFIFVHDDPRVSDIIFVPGGACGEIAEHAARLYHQGLAPYILVSGKYSILKKTFDYPASPEPYRKMHFNTECDFLCTVLLQNGVPESALIREKNAAFTYENAIYSRKLTDQLGIKTDHAILSCQAFHSRRALMYYQLLFPETTFYVSPTVTFDISRDNWYLKPEKIDLVLGELERCGSQFHDILKNRLPRDILD